MTDKQFGPYNAWVTRVVDGDTIDCVITLDDDKDLGFGIIRGPTVIKKRVRLAGVDAPETYGVKKYSEEWHAGQESKERLMSLLRPPSNCVLHTEKERGKYGRYIARVVNDNGQDVGQVMLNEGFVKERS